jgi:hypothetical protein
MGKIIETDEEIVKMVESEFEKTGLDQYGLNLKVMSLKKAKDVIKVSRASAATEFLAKKEDIIQVFIYEEAFNMLDEKTQKFMIEFAMSGVSYDSEKDKILIESNPFQYLFNMRKLYGGEADNMLESSYLAISQLNDKDKQQPTE